MLGPRSRFRSRGGARTLWYFSYLYQWLACINVPARRFLLSFRRYERKRKPIREPTDVRMS